MHTSDDAKGLQTAANEPAQGVFTHAMCNHEQVVLSAGHRPNPLGICKLCITAGFVANRICIGRCKSQHIICTVLLQEVALISLEHAAEDLLGSVCTSFHGAK